MSTRPKGEDSSPPVVTDTMTSTKKRKHTSEDKEASKKKKRRKTEDAKATVATTTEAEPVTDGKKKKKKSKSKDKDIVATAQEDRASSEVHNAALPDAAAENEESSAPPALNGAASQAGVEEETEIEAAESLNLLESEEPSTFYSTRISLYLSIPAISLETASSSILATHLAPLLLTYFPPAQGIVLGFSDPVLSAKAGSSNDLPLVPPGNGQLQPQAEVLSKTADENGVCWVWLTATFLVFRPERGDELHGWTNVTSEGFVGLVSYNYFQTAVHESRIPKSWIWNGPTKEQLGKIKKKAKKARLRDDSDENEVKADGAVEVEDSAAAPYQDRLQDDGGFFTDASGSKIPPTLRFRVVDTEVVPAHDRTKWSLQIDGTLLDEKAEQAAVEEERRSFNATQQRSRSRTPGGDVLMTGALGLSREGSVASVLSGNVPVRHRRAY
ncbi:hypothetical protein PV08_10959 [Exophiala spinifera]|uniref:DNA-directed RNA polymerase subunit n=1 Tax=Exophiala spinifera TaxID=91928 RepID=A0A0D1ZF82_9EURO|nr:uncharacterized protein PV08_10959 [Exophiala spinifera]KIW11657.1 hypothetical protein PV08_10959 [Exophiala spinifera]